MRSMKRRTIGYILMGAALVGFLAALGVFARVQGILEGSLETTSEWTLSAQSSLGEYANNLAAIIPEKATPQAWYCAQDAALYDQGDTQFCSRPPIQNEFRSIEINLSDNRILFYENGMLRRTFPVAYQAPYGKWFQTPTGYFHVGVKNRKFMSSIVPVYMEYAVQLYEDFFIHGIPYHEDGTRVTSQFSGGCIRLEDDVAKDFYNLAQTGDPITSYLTLSKLQTRNGIQSPVDQGGFWVRQRFNSPLKTDWAWHEDKRDNYIQHAGLDLAPFPQEHDLTVKSIADGVVEQIIVNGKEDGGLGNAVIIRMNVTSSAPLYALYGHLYEVSVRAGDLVEAGAQIGVAGNTGYGCEYWKVGKDGCSSTDAADIHLHLEIKSKPVLQAPEPDECRLPSGREAVCIGYTSQDPDKFGYIDPLRFIYDFKDQP